MKSEFSITACLAAPKRMTLTAAEKRRAFELWERYLSTAEIAKALDVHEAAVAKAVCAKGIGIVP